MGLVSYSLPNLIGGVSQQPDSLRVPNAHESVVNSWPSLVSGLQKRPSTDVVAQLSAPDTSIPAGHVYNDPISGQTFFILVSDNDIRVFNADGDEKIVNGSLAGSYLDFSSNARDNCEMKTVGDTTFILNTTVTVTASDVSETGDRVDPTDRWTIFIKQSIPNSHYTIYVNGSQEADFLTGVNVDASTALESTSEIATELTSDLSGGGFTVTRYSSTIALSVPAGHDVAIFEEGRAGDSIAVFKDTVEDFSDLPPQEEVGRLLKVSGDPSQEEDDYYVEHTDDGRWIETYGYGEGQTLDDSTMPHKIVYDQGTDEFTFSTHSWSDRLVGDKTAVPQPSFVDNTIQSLFIHADRFGFLSDEYLILSEVDDYENFWRTTAVQLIDSDPIDISTIVGRVAILNHVVPFNKTLLLFSDKTQFVLEEGNRLSPNTAVAKFATEFSASVRTKPINIGPYIYFADDSANNIRLMEYYINNVNNNEDADDATVQVPEYMESPAKAVKGSTRLNLILIQGNDDATLYGYRFEFGRDAKVVSSWDKWEFNGDIVYYEFVGNYLYMFINYSDGLYLERMRVEEDPVSVITDFAICLDHSVTLADCTSVSYDSSTGLTTFTTPYEYPDDVTFVTAPASDDAGLRFEMTNTTGNTYTVEGDVTGYTDAIIGIPVEFYWKLSTQFVRERKGNGTVVIQDGRLSLRYASLFYKFTSSFNVKVTLEGGRTYTYTFEGRTLGSPTNILDQLPLETGEFRFPIYGQNLTTDIEITDDSPYHCTFTALEWTGRWRPHGGNRL